MKKLFLLTIAIISSLTFTSCEKTEILTNEITSVEKSIGNQLNGTSWKVVSVVSIPKNIAISWSNKAPKLNFSVDYIEMNLGRDNCNKHYMIAGDDLIVNYSNCVIGNQNNQDLVDLFEGRFKYLISDNGEEMILKNDMETEITLQRVIQLSTSNTVSITTNSLTQ